jgi:hypothetical protein
MRRVGGVMAKGLPHGLQEVFGIMELRPIFPILDEELSLREEFAA